MIKRQNELNPIATISIVPVIWGINFTVMKIGLLSLSPMVFNTSRLLVSAVTCWVFLLVFSEYVRVSREDIGKITITSLVGFAFPQIGITLGVSLTTAGNCSLIMALVPVSVLLLNRLLGYEVITRKGFIGIMISFIGVVIIILGSGSGFQVSTKDLAGIVILLVAQFGVAYYTVASQSLLKKYSPYQLIAWTMTISTLAFLMISWSGLIHANWETVALSGWMSIAFSGVFALALGNFIWIWAVREMGSTRTAVFNNLTPVFAILTGSIFLHESFGLQQLLGAIIILTGMNMSRQRRKKLGQEER